MAGLRAFSFELPKSGSLVLNPDESHHLVRVRRAREGDPVEVINGSGLRATARLTRAHAREATVAIEQVEHEQAPAWRLTLAQALPKGKTMDSVVQRATELGADRIVPLFTAQSEVDLDQRRAAQKQEKWRQTALESAKQCGNPWLPEIDSPIRIEAFLPATQKASHRLVAALTPQTRPVREVLQSAKSPQEVILLVGPEGDFSSEEYEAIEEAGFAAVNLGPRVLRVETAACSLLALALASLREHVTDRPA